MTEDGIMTTTIEITAADNEVRKIKFMVDGKPWSAPATHTEIYQREDGLWFVGWTEGAVGPFESSQFALAVSQAMRAPPP
jgi:hypothetical protein